VDDALPVLQKPAIFWQVFSGLQRSENERYDVVGILDNGAGAPTGTLGYKKAFSLHGPP